MKKIEIFTDGACRGNPGPGGWGAVLRYGDNERELFGGEPDTTNNRMELTPAIRALEALKESCEVDLTTDSQYVRKGISEWLPAWKARNWRTSDRKPVKNADLWQLLEQAAARHQVHWHWVKEDSNNDEKESDDQIANRGIDRL